MAQYLLSIEGTGGEIPPPEILDPIMRNLDALDTEMRDAGIWVFAGALHEPSTATVVRSRDGETLLTDGPYTEAKEHIGGFTVIDVPDLDAALGWARRLAGVLEPLWIEVRPFYG